MADDIFDISFEHNGEVYKGWVNPSDKLNESGTPVSFHVVLNDVSSGYLSFSDCKWTVNEPRPEGVVEAAGKAIEKHYKL
jgi:hypothetical protein